MTIRNTAAIRELRPDVASKAIPVRIKAMVTYYDRYGKNLFLVDSAGGIFADFSEPRDLTMGSRVIVSGVTNGDFTNYITHTEVKKTESGPIIKATPVRMQRLASGEADCEFVSVLGTIRSASVLTENSKEMLELRLQNEGIAVDVRIFNFRDVDIDSLLDAEVRVTGAAAGYFNNRKELVGVFVASQSADQIQVLKRPLLNPYLRPLQPLEQILRRRLGLQLGHRTHVQGTVSYVNPGYSITVQDGSEALVIRTRRVEPVKVGDQVDVVGFVAFGDYSPILVDADYRVIGSGQHIQPTPIKDNTLLDGTSDSKLVSVDATLLNLAHDSNRYTFALSSGKSLFSALLDGPTVTSLQGVQPGSRLRIKGIYSVETNGIWKLVRGYRILLRSPSDITVLGGPEWWNKQHLLYIAGGLLAIAFLSFSWVIFLGRQVRRQTTEIRRVLEQDAERNKQLAGLHESRSRVLEKINSREPLSSVLRSVMHLVDQQGSGVSWCLHLLSEPGTLDLVPECCSSSELLQRLALVPSSSAEICAQAVTQRSAVERGGTESARSLPIILSGGEVTGAITIVQSSGFFSAALIERLDLATQLAALAIENRRLYERLTHRSQHDTLTGLPNRALLDEMLTQSIDSARQSGHRIAIAYFDLDKFKQVNDIYGHNTGDIYLQSVAGRLRHSLRDCDTLARVGGDEFIALITNVRDRAHASDVVQRLTQSLDDPIQAGGGRELACSASFGIAIFPEDGRTLDQLKHHADESMYKAKRAAAANLDPSVGMKRSESLSPDELRGAINQNRLVIHYQPIFSRSGRVTSLEALARIRNPNGELTSPDCFIETAEKSGLIIQMGEIVLREACYQATKWERQTHAALVISVNISAAQLSEPHFSDKLLQIIADSELPPRLLRLELTESILVENLVSATEHLQRLRRTGVKIALDDFGTGYSSLSMLQRLPFDVVKIDHSFVTALRTPSGFPLLKAIFSVAESLGVETVAEGVELVSHADSLIRLGCTEFQGYGLARPMPSAAIDAILEQWLTPVASLNARLFQKEHSQPLELTA